MSSLAEQKYVSIPLSVQKDGDVYLVGSSDLGDFYQFPEPGVRILNLLQSGNDVASVKSRLDAEYPDALDVDQFVGQLASIGFIHPAHERDRRRAATAPARSDTRNLFDVDPRVARAIFSPPVLACCGFIMLYAVAAAIRNPALRLNPGAFYTPVYRTPLLLLVLVFSGVQVVLHESGHMLAAARHGIKCRYGIGNRLWTIVAESDLTGILTLPKAQRYFPMLAGLLVDAVSMAVLTIVLEIMLLNGAGRFAMQVVQALILEVAISIPWQFNIFVKTDIYFVLCTYFNQPDLDTDAHAYVRDIVHRVTFGRFGSRNTARSFKSLPLLRAFSLIWLLGRALSLIVLFTVFLPTIARYLMSAIDLFTGPSAGVWAACDTLLYVTITFTMLSIGMYMWFKQK